MATDYRNESLSFFNHSSLHGSCITSFVKTSRLMSLVTGVGTGLSSVDNSNRDGGRLLLLLLLLCVSSRSRGLPRERVGSGRVTRRIRRGRSSAREPSGRVDIVGASRRVQGVGSSVLGTVDDLVGLGSTGLEERSDERVVDLLSVVRARVKEPDEEGELECEVLGDVVEDDPECGGFEEVEEADYTKGVSVRWKTSEVGSLQMIQ